MWKNILKARYGGVRKAVIVGAGCKSKRKELIWWKDMMAASKLKTNESDYFTSIYVSDLTTVEIFCFGMAGGWEALH